MEIGIKHTSNNDQKGPTQISQEASDKGILQEQAPGGFLFVMLSLGCKCNRYEADAVAQKLRSLGGKEITEAEAQEADIAVVNTCAVTGEAARKSRQTIRHLRKRYPKAVIGAMGCATQLEKGSKDSDVWTGTDHRMAFAQNLVDEWLKKQVGKGSLLGQPCSDQAVSRVSSVPFSYAHQQTAKTDATHLAQLLKHEKDYEDYGSVLQQTETRAQIKIEDGCNQFCTYCAICLARGRVRSRSQESILKEAESLAQKGHSEIVLTGTHLCSYGSDWGETGEALIQLVEQLNQIPGLYRIRLGSLEPAYLTDELIRRLGGCQYLCPHFHLSLQSGSDTVLSRMNRHYTAQDFRALVEKLRSTFGDPGLTTDVITGFPGETELEFEESLRFVREIGFSRLHVFPFSPREGTPAAGMRQLPQPLIKERAQKMITLGDELQQQALAAQVGRRFTVLLEQPQEGGGFSGYTERYDPACLIKVEGDLTSSSQKTREADQRLFPEFQRGQLWRAQAVDVKDGILQLQPTEMIQP